MAVPKFSGQVKAVYGGKNRLGESYWEVRTWDNVCLARYDGKGAREKARAKAKADNDFAREWARQWRVPRPYTITHKTEVAS